jgi:hypothetical protein
MRYKNKYQTLPPILRKNNFISSRTGDYLMTEDQVNKSIGQMRGVFVFFGVLVALGALVYLFSSFNDASYLFLVVLEGAVAFCFLMAFRGLGARNKSGFTYARVSSIILLFGFPILTIFGIIYLNKLGKTEMKQALNAA